VGGISVLDPRLVDSGDTLQISTSSAYGDLKILTFAAG